MCISYKNGYKFQLSADYVVMTSVSPRKVVRSPYLRLEPTGCLTIMNGYAWDGATWAPDLRSVVRASLVHDALYQLMRSGKINRLWKDTVDNDFLRIMREDGAGWLARIYYRGMRLGTRIFNIPGKPREILQAPKGCDEEI